MANPKTKPATTPKAEEIEVEEIEVEETTNYEDIELSVNIVDVRITDKLTRVIVDTDKTFPAFNAKTGEEITTNSFGISIRELTEQFRANSVIRKALKRAMGQQLNPMLFSFLLIGSQVKIKRVFHAEGEEMPREINGVKFYEVNTYTTEFDVDSFVPDWDDEDIADIKDIIKNQLTVSETTVKVADFRTADERKRDEQQKQIKLTAEAMFANI